MMLMMVMMMMMMVLVMIAMDSSKYLTLLMTDYDADDDVRQTKVVRNGHVHPKDQ